MRAKIGIVTVLYNSESVLEMFYSSLDKQTYREIVLYIVDNKSTDNSLIKAKEIFNNAWFNVEFIENDINDGVAKGNNIGIYAALKDKCDYVLLSNNDVCFDKNTIESLLMGMLKNKSTLSVPKIYFYGTNLIWAAGGKLNTWRKGFPIAHIGANEIDNGQFEKVTFHDYAPTCFMLISKEVFERVGYMDEKYFVYWDDTDFAYRAYKKGEKIVYIPDSVVYHKESACTSSVGTSFITYYLYRNLAYFYIKNFSILYFLFVTAYIILALFRDLFRFPSIILWTLKWKAYFHGVLLYVYDRR